VITVTTKKNSSFNQFGKIFYSIDSRVKKIESEEYLFLFKGFFYFDTPFSPEDIINFLIEEKQYAGFKKFKGSYCGCLINKRNESIFIFSDQLGLNDLFYYFQDKNLIISDKFTDFFKLKTFSLNDVDQQAITQFVLYEHVVGDRTFLSQVKALSYASVIKFDLSNQTSKITRYWQYLPCPKNNFDTKKGFAELDKLFKKAALRILKAYPDNDFLFGLSGGLDSRLAAKYAIECGYNLKTFVFGSKKSDAIKISKKLAKKLKLKRNVHHIKNNFWDLKKEHVLHNPMMNIMYTTYCSVKNNLQSANCVFSGFNGDNIFGSHIKQFYFDDKLSFIEKLNKRYKQVPLNINDTDLPYYDLLKLEDWQKLEIFNFENRQLRFIKNSPSFNFYGKYENMCSMFADIDVVEFALTIPSRQLSNCEFYYNFFRNYHKELIKIRPHNIPYKISDSLLIKKIKSRILLKKFRVKRKYGFYLPVYPSIKFTSHLDWPGLFSNINFESEFKNYDLKNFSGNFFFELGNTYLDIIAKFRWLTIQNFLETYFKKEKNGRHEKFS